MPLLYSVSARLGARAFVNKTNGNLRAKSVRALTEGVAVMKNDIVTGKLIPVNLGTLQQAIVASGRVDRSRLTGVLGSSVRQTLAMEKGRRAGMRQPPSRAMESWVKRKGIATGKANIARVAYIIGLRIAQFGTRIPLRFSNRGGMFKALTRIMATKWPKIVKRNLSGR